MSILDAAKKAKEKKAAGDNFGNDDDVTFQCILRNLGVSYESCQVLITWPLDERKDIIEHARRGLAFWFEG